MRHLSILTFLLLPILVNAQQEQTSDIYWTKAVNFNPATIGIQEKAAVNVNYNQWYANLSDSPKEFSANAALKVEKLKGAVGLSYLNNSMGLVNFQSACLNYAFHLPLKKNLISFGISTGVGHLVSDPIWVEPNNSPDPSQAISINKYGLQLKTGAVFHSENMNVGVSVTQLDQSRYYENNVGYTAIPNYHFFIDYNFHISENISITPRLKASTDGQYNSLKTAVQATFHKKLWMGALFNSSTSSFGGFIGYDLFDKYRLGYCYTSYSRLFGDSHEFVLSYLLKN